MTEAEWLTTTDPRAMLGFLEGKAGERKLRLFMCACCRLLWDRLEPGVMREAPETGERFADGLVTWEEYQRYVSSLHSATSKTERPFEALAARSAAICSVAPAGSIGGLGLSRDYAHFARVTEATGGHQPRLLRDIFGNPFRPPTPAATTPTLRSLARAAYEERSLPGGEMDPVRLAVLADALEDVGASADVAAHLRGAGPHVRGCWAVDRCLGKA